MKTLLAVILAATIAQPAVAGLNSRKIFKALDFKAADITPAGEPDFVLNLKSVGGLSCQEKDFRAILVMSEHDCTFKIDGRDDGAIYSVLKAEELPVEGPVGVAVFEKTVANLKCRKAYPVVPNPVAQYQCRVE